ncbi:MAG: 50S ribosomal protein L3 N(5)-glutamine methyltransferase [Pseudomonadota bacterium]
MIASVAQLDDAETIGQALDYCNQKLAQSDVFFGHGTDSPWDESVQLVLHAAGLALDSSGQVVTQHIDRQTRARIDELLQKRIFDRTPLPYLIGRAWFAGLEFGCDERAIIPRSPIAELILNEFQPWYSGPEPKQLLDLCCGGGCIGLASAHYFPDLHVDLLDIDQSALTLAEENAERLGVQGRVSILQSDVFAAVANRRYDLILSNPPYVNGKDFASMPAEYRHEPERALASGEDGLDLTRRILDEAVRHLTSEGLLVVEVGNSWTTLEHAYPQLPFTWLEFEQGGHGVFVLTARELQEYKATVF